MKRALLVFLSLALALPVVGDVRTVTYTTAQASPSFTGTATAEALSANTLAATTSLTVGASSPTAITNIRVYAPTCTPTASTAAIQTLAFACTVTGLVDADNVIVTGPVPTSLCPLVDARTPAAADTLTLYFSVLTAAICTPASGTYNVVAFRN